MQVLEDLGDGRVGVIAKVHHSVMDGAAAVGVLGALFDLEPTSPSHDPVARGEPNRTQGIGIEQAARILVHLPVALGAHRRSSSRGGDRVRALVAGCRPFGHVAVVGAAHVVEPLDLVRRAA